MELKVNAKKEDALDFINEVKEEGIIADSLDKLEELADKFQALEADIDELEDALKLKREAFMQVSQVAIPTLLRQHGLSEIRLKNKKKIIVKEEVSVSVPDDKRDEFVKFLKEQNAEDLIKLQFAFDRMPVPMQKQLFDFLNEKEYSYSSKSDVHPQTLKKFFKELLGIGEDDREEGIKEGRYKQPTDVDMTRAVNMYTFFTTKIK